METPSPTPSEAPTLPPLVLTPPPARSRPAPPWTGRPSPPTPSPSPSATDATPTATPTPPRTTPSPLPSMSLAKTRLRSSPPPPLPGRCRKTHRLAPTSAHPSPPPMRTTPSLTYTLEGTDKDSFNIDNSGQIKTRSGVTYDYESVKDHLCRDRQGQRRQQLRHH